MIALIVAMIFLLLLIGAPIFLVLIIPSIVALQLYFPNIDVSIVVQRMVAGVNSYTLLAIPFFIFAADIISRGNIGKRLINFSKVFVGHLPGGMAMTTILTCFFFGAISGAGQAAIVAVGSIVHPSLLAEKYEEKFSMGLILTSSTLAMLVPPGIAMILYGIVSGESIGKVFFAGLSVGIVIAITLIIFSVIYAIIHKIPRSPRAQLSQVWKSFREAAWALGLPVVILGGIYGGIMTTSEAAAVAVVYVLFVEMVVYRSLGIKELYRVAIKSSRTTAMILILLAAGSLLSWVLTLAQIPQMMSSFLSGASVNMFLFFLIAIFLVAGMFLDPNSAIVILTPLFYPIAMSLGIDPIHLGIIIVLNLSIGMITPPFGINIFVGMAQFGISFGKAVSGVMPFIIMGIVVLFLIAYVPIISMWLPNLMF